MCGPSSSEEFFAKYCDNILRSESKASGLVHFIPFSSNSAANDTGSSSGIDYKSDEEQLGTRIAIVPKVHAGTANHMSDSESLSQRNVP